MAYLLVEGSKFLFSSTFGSAVAVSSASNGDPSALVTGTAHGYSANDELLFNSGWEDAKDTVWKAATASGSNLTLGLLDTTDTQWYPTGAGIGTLQKISNWVEIGQVLDSQPNGGGARSVNIDPLSRRNGIKMPAGFEAIGLDFTIGYDPALSEQIILDKLSRALGKKVAFKFLLSGGQCGYGYGNVSLSPIPRMAKGSAISKTLSLGFLGQFTGYPS